MDQPIKIGVIGDFEPDRRSHMATNAALSHAADALSLTLDIAWLPTLSLENKSSEMGLKSFDALWCAPGGQYKSIRGALRAIQFSREQNLPFIGT